jgi:hypothetical protein
LYRRTADDLLLKCLDPDQARLAMAKVHEGICGTHQSAPKMKWLLRRACFYWPTMIVLGTIKDVKSVRSSIGHSEVGDWISLARYILRRLKGIAL